MIKLKQEDMMQIIYVDMDGVLTRFDTLFVRG